jgi:TetR/AcrR family transcriptional regulator, transcriptional repressor for nem operon
MPTAVLPETKRKLVDAGVNLMRARGYNATTVDEICADAGVTKGGFFHYFKSKDDLAKAAVTQFFEDRVKNYEQAPFRKLADPLDRVFGRLDYVKEATGGSARVTKGCLIGVFTQELAFTNSAIRDICQGFFSRMARDFSQDLAEAKAAHASAANFAPKALAQFYISIVQGSLMLAKSAGNNEVFHNNIEQFRGHLKYLFGLTGTEPTGNSGDNPQI